MADYRDWCSVCNAEINFGSHEPDCPEPARIYAAQRRLEWEREQRKKAEETPFKTAEPDELFEKLFQIEREIDAIREKLDPLEASLNGAYRVLNYRDLTFKYLEWRRGKRDKAERWEPPTDPESDPVLKGDRA